LKFPQLPWGCQLHGKAITMPVPGESLTNLSLDKLDEIRNQVGIADWSGQVISTATLDHLDTQALAKAREFFTKKYANSFSIDEVMSWPESVFLNRAKLTKDGQITRATMLLLGKAESAHLLTTSPCSNDLEARWS
jgi:ATP-dependent DNA helicase RecG